MSKAIHTLLDASHHGADPGMDGIQGDFPMDEAVIERESISELSGRLSNWLRNGSDAGWDQGDLGGDVREVGLDRYGSHPGGITSWGTERLFLESKRTAFSVNLEYSKSPEWLDDEPSPWDSWTASAALRTPVLRWP